MKVLGIAGGNGVMLYPLRKYLVGNIEPRGDYRTPHDIQWTSNFGKTPLYTKYVLPEEFVGVDVIVGHPTCGHSSALAYSRGKKLGDAKSDETISLFVEAVNKYKPEFFLFENLPTMFKSFPEKDFDESFPGYKLVKHIASVANFGNSQISRVRLVVVGIREDSRAKKKHFKVPEIVKENLKTVEELEYIDGDPVTLCHLREPDDTVVCMEKDFKKLNLAQIREIWNSPEYKGKKKWDARTTGKGNMVNLPGVYRNLAGDFPLTARKQNRQFNSKGYIMSPRELARINGVPDSFTLYCDTERLQYWINKARVTATKTPPPEITKWFKRIILKHYGKKSS